MFSNDTYLLRRTYLDIESVSRFRKFLLQNKSFVFSAASVGSKMNNDSRVYVSSIYNFCYFTGSRRGIRRIHGACRKRVYILSRYGFFTGTHVIRW